MGPRSFGPRGPGPMGYGPMMQGPMGMGMGMGPRPGRGGRGMGFDFPGPPNGMMMVRPTVFFTAPRIAARLREAAVQSQGMPGPAVFSPRPSLVSKAPSNAVQGMACQAQHAWLVVLPAHRLLTGPICCAGAWHRRARHARPWARAWPHA